MADEVPQPIPQPILQTAKPCQVHNKHTPASHVNDVHHVWPLGEGGPDIAANRVVVCATGHHNIHKLISLFKVHHGNVPYTELRTFAFEERNLAQLGYERITRQAM